MDENVLGSDRTQLSKVREQQKKATGISFSFYYLQ